MKRQDYYPVRIGDQIVWLRNFKTKLPLHATTLALPAGTVTAVLLDVDTAIYALETYRGALATAVDAAYQRIDDVLDHPGLAGTVSWLGFTPPAGAPTPVAYGTLKRIFTLITDTIRKAPGYDLAIGGDLGIVGPVQAAPDAATTTPEFALRSTGGGKLEVVWTKGVFDGVKLEFDLGTAGTRSDIDLRPNYTLNWLPAPGVPAMVRVRLRYIYKGEDFGNWSAWEATTVTGS